LTEAESRAKRTVEEANEQRTAAQNEAAELRARLSTVQSEAERLRARLNALHHTEREVNGAVSKLLNAQVWMDMRVFAEVEWAVHSLAASDPSQTAMEGCFTCASCINQLYGFASNHSLLHSLVAAA
jgi:hypothetical protein